MSAKRIIKIRKPAVKRSETEFIHPSGIPIPDLTEKQALIAKIEANSKHDTEALARLRDPEFRRPV